ncbi:MAG: glutamine-hydrolyzing GMP synthase [Bacteroidales bacterium]|jgi:GMP synthase (glutamine-hydrolysing)|nr:glutamine-hydrolyzing GMP synthase [Bacteroidales bacterium]MCI2121937.1 glutamine-hydrolyzing GMP synthase [Bacteroidales bacterium]MCI2145468.1 glutamine-hydrolyzing GMP synthase [Bacteroidales bacterium]
MPEKIIILDFGSQVTQLIGRRIREMSVYCEIHPYDKMPSIDDSVKGIVLSGSPCSVRQADAPDIDLSDIKGKVPMLGICYGAQLLARKYGGEVDASLAREYGRAELNVTDGSSPLFAGIPQRSQVWMSHGDTIAKLPAGARAIASSDNIANAAYCFEGERTYAVQFHPEVFHTQYGPEILENFVKKICGCSGDWTADSFIDTTVNELKAKIGEDDVILGLSGGVDSSVAAVLMHKAIGNRLHCIFVDNGLLRKNEFTSVLSSYKGMGLNVTGVDAGREFLDALKGITDPELKRKAIGKTFIDVFDREAGKVKGAKWLAQGTIYPDVIESTSVNGPSCKIKSHHNVGGLPANMHLRIVEPLRSLFKDEVRRVGRTLGIPNSLVGRHPFPGPSLGIRILGEVTPEKLEILRGADAIYIDLLHEWKCDRPSASDPRTRADNLYDAIWQAGAILLPVKSVGVMGDERTYEYTIALRAVTSTDGMTADWYPLPYDFLAQVSDDIINKVRGVNRVVYDISSKPPATIEWE